MIGVDTFSSVFGGAPEHTASRMPEHIRAIIRAGYSPVLCRPMTAEPLCTLSPTMAKRTGPHPCGAAHVLDDPAKSGAIVKRLLDQHGSLNVALHLGRSRLAVLVQWLEWVVEPITVEAGQLGLTWFTLPEGADVQPGRGPLWSLAAGDVHILVPPAVLPAGAHRLVGGTMPAPAWLVSA